LIDIVIDIDAEVFPEAQIAAQLMKICEYVTNGPPPLPQVDEFDEFENLCDRSKAKVRELSERLENIDGLYSDRACVLAQIRGEYKLLIPTRDQIARMWDDIVKAKKEDSVKAKGGDVIAQIDAIGGKLTFAEAYEKVIEDLRSEYVKVAEQTKGLMQNAYERMQRDDASIQSLPHHERLAALHDRLRRARAVANPGDANPMNKVVASWEAIIDKCRDKHRRLPIVDPALMVSSIHDFQLNLESVAASRAEELARLVDSLEGELAMNIDELVNAKAAAIENLCRRVDARTGTFERRVETLRQERTEIDNIRHSMSDLVKEENLFCGSSRRSQALIEALETAKRKISEARDSENKIHELHVKYETSAREASADFTIREQHIHATRAYESRPEICTIIATLERLDRSSKWQQVESDWSNLNHECTSVGHELPAISKDLDYESQRSRYQSICADERAWLEQLKACEREASDALVEKWRNEAANVMVKITGFASRFDSISGSLEFQNKQVEALYQELHASNYQALCHDWNELSSLGLQNDLTSWPEIDNKLSELRTQVLQRREAVGMAMSSRDSYMEFARKIVEWEQYIRTENDDSKWRRTSVKCLQQEKNLEMQMLQNGTAPEKMLMSYWETYVNVCTRSGMVNDPLAPELEVTVLTNACRELRTWVELQRQELQKLAILLQEQEQANETDGVICHLSDSSL
jgi:hypothetical protein